MAKSGHYPHEFYVKKTLDYLKSKGCRTINLANRTPDGLVISRDGKKIFAIEIIMHSKDGKDKENRARMKVSNYMELGFDNVYALTIDKYNDYEKMWHSTDGRRYPIIDNMPNETTLWAQELYETQAKFEAEWAEVRRRYEEEQEKQEIST